MSFAAPARPSIFGYWITVMAILSQPDALSLSGNLKDFVITSSEVVSFKLYMGETLLLDNRYLPDYNNQLRISVRDIVESHLATDLPSSDTFTQNNVCASFTADIDGTEVNFAAIRCGVRNYSGTAADFLTSNFLTWQPQTVETGYSQPQWLTYYNPGAASVSIKVKFYTKAGGSTVKSLATVTAGSCISVNVQFARIFALDEGDNYGYYDIYVENSAGTRLTYVQRYVLREEDRNIRCFVFMNSLGGIDCAAFNGHNTYSPRHTYTNAQYSEESIAANIDTERSYTQSTGYVDERTSHWLDDMFNSYGCYVVEEGVVRPIVLDEATVSHNHTEQLHSFEFSYKLSDSSTLLNLPRAEVLPEGLQIETPDKLFFLAPRLVEFPEAELDDSLLFLVQSPYEQNWKKITAGTLISSLQEYFENYSLTFAHTHNNLSVLNKFSESEDGKLLWNGEPIKGQGGGVDPEWKKEVDAAIVDINLLKSWFYEDAKTGNIYLAKKNGAARNFVTFGDVVTGEGNEPGGDEPVVGGISSLVVKLGAVSYEGVGTTDVVVNLPAYPTELPASDVYAWAKAANKPSYTFSEIDNMPSTLSGYGITDAYSKTDIDNKVSALQQAINLLNSWFYEDAETGNIYLAKKNGAARNFVTFGDVVTGEGNEPGGDEPVVGGISSLVVKLGAVSYEGVGTSDVVVNLPAYPTTLPASDVYAWAKQPTKPAYTAAEVGALTQATGDVRYLKLAGGIMSGTDETILTVNTAKSNNYVFFSCNNTRKASVGFYNGIAGISTETTGSPRIGIQESTGMPVYSPNLGATCYPIWHSGNDGSGSGLDADLLDGYHLEYVLDHARGFDVVAQGAGIDLNTALNNGGLVYNYTTPVWVNGPSGLGYGIVLGILPSGGPGYGLAAQLAWDSEHNVAAGTGDMWFRTKNNLGWCTNWKKVAVQSSANDFIAHGNEFNFVPAGFNNSVWFNYRAVDRSSVTINGYSFGNGAKGLADISAANANISSYLTLSSDIRLASGNGLSVLTTTNAAASINVKSIYVSGSYDGAANEGCISLHHSLDLNRQKSSTSGISFYAPSYNSWIMYMAPPGSGQGPKGNIVAPTGNIVTSWGLRQAIEQASGYGWSWEILSATGTAPMPIMELSAKSGELNIRNSLTVGYRYIGTPWKMSTHGLISDEWLRTVGSVGWYSQTYGGGIYMVDSTWVRVYNAKGFWVDNDIYTTTKVIAVGGYQVGTTPDIGWYYSALGSRICAGSSTARGVNVGSLLVSNAWADYTKVPANGIYCKGNITTPGEVSTGTTSDRRLKCNIVTLSDIDTVTVLKALNPVSFTWNSIAEKLSGGRDAGISRSFVADEFLRVLPNAGRKVWDIYDSIYIEQAIPYLTRGWQIHEKRLLALEKENKSLKEEINRLRRA